MASDKFERAIELAEEMEADTSGEYTGEVHVACATLLDENKEYSERVLGSRDYLNKAASKRPDFVREDELVREFDDVVDDLVTDYRL